MITSKGNEFHRLVLSLVQAEPNAEIPVLIGLAYIMFCNMPPNVILQTLIQDVYFTFYLWDSALWYV